MESIYDNPNFINTSEAISDCILFGNNCLIIPYINLALMEYNPINNKSSFVKYGYYVFEGVRSLIAKAESVSFKIESTGYTSSDTKKEYLIVGGYSKEMKGAEVELQFENSSFYMPGNTEISPTLFINQMDDNQYEDNIFLSFENASKLLLDKLGINYYRLII